MFEELNGLDIFNVVRTNALAETGKQDAWGFSVVIRVFDKDVDTALRQTYTFSLESLSIYDSFMHAGALMNIPVTFTNGCFFIGNKADDDTSVRRVTDDSADPFK